MDQIKPFKERRGYGETSFIFTSSGLMLRRCQVRLCLLGFYPVGYFYQLTRVFAKNPLTEISYQPSE